MKELLRQVFRIFFVFVFMVVAGMLAATSSTIGLVVSQGESINWLKALLLLCVLIIASFIALRVVLLLESKKEQEERENRMMKTLEFFRACWKKIRPSSN
jgi:thiosulfate reductase cytochrome b subunit